MASLAKVFGPTIVGHAVPNPEPSVIWKDTQLQPKVMERLLGITGDYWRQYLSPMDNPEPPTSPTPSVQSSPGMMMSPATPEMRPGETVVYTDSLANEVYSSLVAKQCNTNTHMHTHYSSREPIPWTMSESQVKSVQDTTDAKVRVQSSQNYIVVLLKHVYSLC